MRKISFIKLSSLTVAGILLASCNSMQNNKAGPASVGNKALSSKIDVTKIPDWNGSGDTGAYICDGKPSCSNLSVTVYQTSSASASELQSIANVNKNPKMAKAQFSLGFALAGSGISPDGELEAISINGRKGAGMPIKGKKPNGSPRDPGYMIMIAGTRNLHVFVGISKTKPQAKAAAKTVANAWKQ